MAKHLFICLQNLFAHLSIHFLGVRFFIFDFHRHLAFFCQKTFAYLTDCLNAAMIFCLPIAKFVECMETARCLVLFSLIRPRVPVSNKDEIYWLFILWAECVIRIAAHYLNEKFVHLNVLTKKRHELSTTSKAEKPYNVRLICWMIQKQIQFSSSPGAI